MPLSLAAISPRPPSSTIHVHHWHSTMEHLITSQSLRTPTRCHNRLSTDDPTSLFLPTHTWQQVSVWEYFGGYHKTAVTLVHYHWRYCSLVPNRSVSLFYKRSSPLNLAVDFCVKFLNIVTLPVYSRGICWNLWYDDLIRLTGNYFSQRKEQLQCFCEKLHRSQQK